MNKRFFCVPLISAMVLSAAAMCVHAEVYKDQTYGNLVYMLEDYEEEGEGKRIIITGTQNKYVEEVTIPAQINGVDVTDIYGSSFEGCKELKQVTIPKTVTGIGGSAFKDCASLKSIVIPDSVEYIGYDAFRNCKNLESVTLSAGLHGINNGLFQYCESLKTVNFPEVMTPDPDYLPEIERARIEENAFKCCDSLVNISLSKGLTNIYANAFYSCGSLSAVYIPDVFTTVNKDAFRLCSHTVDIYYAGTEQQWVEAVRPAGGIIKGVRVHCNATGIPDAEIVSVEKTDEGITVAGRSSYDCCVITAVYDSSGTVTDVKIIPHTAGNIEEFVPIDITGAVRAKAFVWRITDGYIVPLCRAEEIEI